MLEKRAELILLAPTSLYASMSTLRIYIVMFNFKRIKRSFDEITEFELKSDEEREFIRKQVKRFSRSSVAYVIFMFSALGSGKRNCEICWTYNLFLFHNDVKIVYHVDSVKIYLFLMQ